MLGPRKLWVALAALTVSVAGCSGGGPRSAGPATSRATPSSRTTPSSRATASNGGTATTTPGPTTTTTTAAPATTVYSPSSPRPSPDDAAAALISFWAEGDRSGAATVAAPGAVSALFAVSYPPGRIQARGCTDASVVPGTCTYRNTGTNGIYEIEVSKAGAGWYVTSVTPEG